MNVLGLLLSFVGVVLLFCVGMPFQVPADAKIGRWSASSVGLRLKSLDDFYTILGLIGSRRSSSEPFSRSWRR